MKLGAGKLCRVHAHDCLYSVVLRDIRAPEAAPNSSSSPLSLPLHGEEAVASTSATRHSSLKRTRAGAGGASAAPAVAELLPGSEPTKRAKLSTTTTPSSLANGATKPDTVPSQPVEPASTADAPAPAPSPCSEATEAPVNTKLSWSPGLVNTQLVPRMPYPEDYFDACVPMNVFAAQVAAACDDLNETNLAGLLGAIGLPSEIVVAAAQAIDVAAGRSPPRPAVDIMASCARIAFRMDADEDEDEAGDTEAAMLADLESLVEHASGGDAAADSEQSAREDSAAAQENKEGQASQPATDSAAPAAADAPAATTPEYPMPSELQLDASQMAELAALPERLRDQRLIALLYVLGGVDILEDEEACSSDEDYLQAGPAAGPGSGALSSSDQPDTIQVVVSAAGDVSVPVSPSGSSQEDAQLEGIA